MSARRGVGHPEADGGGISDADMRETLELITSTTALQVKLEGRSLLDPQVIVMLTEPRGRLAETTYFGGFPEGLAAQCEAMSDLGQYMAQTYGGDGILAAFLVSEVWVKDEQTGERIGEMVMTTGMRHDDDRCIVATQTVTRTDDGQMQLGDADYDGRTKSPLLQALFLGLEGASQPIQDKIWDDRGPWVTPQMRQYAQDGVAMTLDSGTETSVSEAFIAKQWARWIADQGPKTPSAADIKWTRRKLETDGEIDRLFEVLSADGYVVKGVSPRRRVWPRPDRIPAPKPPEEYPPAPAATQHQIF